MKIDGGIKKIKYIEKLISQGVAWKMASKRRKQREYWECLRRM